MFPGSLAYAVPLFLTAGLTGGLALYAFRHRELAGAATLGGMLLAVTVWCTASANEYLALTYTGKLLAMKTEALAIACVPQLWFAFALRHTRRAHWLTLRTQILLSVYGLVIAALVFTNDWHHLVWRSAVINPSRSPGLIVERGVASWIYTALAYAFTLAGIFLYLVTFTQAARIYRTQMGIMLFASLVPLFVSLIYFVGPQPFQDLDFTPFAFGISGIVLAIGLFRYNLLDLSPVTAQVIIDHLQDAVLVLDAHSRLIALNPAAMKLFEVDEHAIGQNALDILHLLISFEKYVDAFEVNTKVEMGTGEEHRWFELTISPLKNAEGQVLGRALLLHDINRERALMQMRDDLTQMIIHDLHNPLSAIYVALDMLGVGQWDNDPALQGSRPYEEKEALKIAYQSSLRAQEMIDSVLSVARLESRQVPVDIAPLNLGDIISAVIRQMKPIADGRALTLEMQMTPDLPSVLADRQLLDRIIRNLIGNAIKFIPVQSRITVATQETDLDVIVSVVDTGPGLPAAVQARLFEKFARGEVVGRGYGLGLAFCKLAVEAMQGRIWSESTPGQGATFYFTLPKAKQSTQNDR